MRYLKNTSILILVSFCFFLTACGTVTQSTSQTQGQSQTPTPLASEVYYLDYGSPAHDLVKSVVQYAVAAGATVSVYSALPAGAGTLVDSQTADATGMFILDIGDNVAANDTVYVIVQESGKLPSNTLVLNR